MDSIAVVKPNMTVARQESLSPFGMLTQVFTEELVRRNGYIISRVENFEAHDGEGMSAVVNGESVYVGSTGFSASLIAASSDSRSTASPPSSDCAMMSTVRILSSGISHSKQ